MDCRSCKRASEQASEANAQQRRILRHILQTQSRTTTTLQLNNMLNNSERWPHLRARCVIPQFYPTVGKPFYKKTTLKTIEEGTPGLRKCGLSRSHPRAVYASLRLSRLIRQFPETHTTEFPTGRKLFPYLDKLDQGYSIWRLYHT